MPANDRPRLRDFIGLIIVFIFLAVVFFAVVGMVSALAVKSFTHACNVIDCTM